MKKLLASAKSDERIFVQIAAYRDAELVSTLRDCIANAEAPAQLRFGVCWQRDDNESLAEFADTINVRIIEVPYQESRGTCWARQQTQTLYDDEPYTMQIDSHHRFAPGWDSAAKRLLKRARREGSAKPLLSSYAPVYEPESDISCRGQHALRLVFDYFSDGGPIQIKPVEIDRHWRDSPLEPARFFSAHFFFTLGQFCREVPYDPSMYFFGEEPSMAIRAFTHGYDLFHPREVLLWHYYGRQKQQRHWSDHRQWWLRNERSMLRYRRLISVGGESQELGEFGLGGQRSLQDYEAYAGLSLSKRAVSTDTLSGEVPKLRVKEAPTNNLEHVINLAWNEVEHLLNSRETDTQLRVDVQLAGAESIAHVIDETTLQDFKQRGTYLLRVYSEQPPQSWHIEPL